MRMPTCVLRALRGAVAVSASCLALMGLVCTNLSAQDSSSNSNQGSSQQAGFQPGGGERNPGAAGGGVVQDWTTLMMLISQTVDPDEWADFGGTGNSRMIPYPNGVWLDAKGHFKRMNRGDLPNVAGARQQWRAGSGLRTVSLKALDTALGMMTARGMEPNAQMNNLAGISHIQYVAIDIENRDILIAGPAAKGNDNGFLLEDLRTLAALMNKDTAPLGCSLDPNNQGILEAQKFLSDASVVARLGRTPQVVADQLKAKVGSHTVNIFGIDATSTTALALVNADEHMKRVGLGLENSTPRIKTYFDHLERNGQAPAQSLIRWWFAYNPATLNVSAAGDLFELPENVVAVMSEQQWVNAKGDRQATGSNDPAADAFAAEMTAKFRQLCANEPVYARLEGIFELGLALQVSIEASKQPSLAEWFPNLSYRDAKASADRQAPKTVEGVTAWDRLKNGTVVAVISGGVKIEPAALASKSNWQSRSVERPSALTGAASSQATAAQWWWD